MIKCDDKSKDCVIVGNEQDILYEFSVICYGMLQGEYDIESLIASLKVAYEKYEDKKEKSTK